MFRLGQSLRGEVNNQVAWLATGQSSHASSWGLSNQTGFQGRAAPNNLTLILSNRSEAQKLVMHCRRTGQEIVSNSRRAHLHQSITMGHSEPSFSHSPSLPALPSHRYTPSHIHTCKNTLAFTQRTTGRWRHVPPRPLSRRPRLPSVSHWQAAVRRTPCVTSVNRPLSIGVCLYH